MVAGGAGYLFTQFEDTEAREAFPCWDEPEFKIPWTMTLTVPDADLAVSNTPVAHETRRFQHAEVFGHRVPWSVHDVDLNAAIGDCGVLRDDGNAALALQVEAVQDPLSHVLVGAEHVALLQHPVDESRLAVVNVGDDGDISKLGYLLHAG